MGFSRKNEKVLKKYWRNSWHSLMTSTSRYFRNFHTSKEMTKHTMILNINREGPETM